MFVDTNKIATALRAKSKELNQRYSDLLGMSIGGGPSYKELSNRADALEDMAIVFESFDQRDGCVGDPDDDGRCPNCGIMI